MQLTQRLRVRPPQSSSGQAHPELKYFPYPACVCYPAYVCRRKKQFEASARAHRMMAIWLRSSLRSASRASVPRARSALPLRSCACTCARTRPGLEAKQIQCQRVLDTPMLGCQSCILQAKVCNVLGKASPVFQ